MSRQNVIVARSAYKETCNTPVVLLADNLQIELLKAKAFNGTGGAINVGIGKKFSTDSLICYSITAASTPDASLNSTLLAGTTTTIFSTTNNDGFMIGCKEKFSVIRFNVTQAEAGSPVYVLRYYDGTNMVTLTAESAPSAYTAGEQVIMFNPPLDWQQGSTAAVGGDASYYYIELVATTAPSTAVQANSLGVAQLFDYQKSLPSLSYVDFDLSPSEGVVLNAKEGVVGYFSGSNNASNTLMVAYFVRK